ncbi:hypothetical protein GCM10011344_24700 [Dokdonia pacifica]|uniref:DUF2975 domain-containing protein n=1 Tax=Dokdonia pacifica TaxID=1627892 RepID=A0A238WS18_9FLAO|nr:DUF2975 domain-containing protein [Dokdonia pacifica]GGG23068.1 hypothetical protein GCM10011344_24700 [Dokdonia pacifica]SNR48479.1 Protein of unknown function [Dokdonia pacifica]
MNLSKITYLVSRIFFYICAAFTVFIFLFSALSFFENRFNIDMPLITIVENQTSITIPFSKLHIEFINSFGIIALWLSFGFYAFYFYALSEFFKVFTKTKVFTQYSIKKLKLFGSLNLIPPVFILLYFIIDRIQNTPLRMDSEYILPIPHLCIALFVYLYIDLIKKGKRVQDENDLTI